MKIPLSFQKTNYDCGTVSLTNAISYLFEREEIPPEIIKGISLFSLDRYDEKGNVSQGGTSRESISLITNWLNNYAETKNFNLICEKLTGKEVTISKIKSCIDNKGVILVRLWQGVQHYAIITNIDKDRVYLFDPYYLDKNYYDDDSEIKMIFNKPFSYNRSVSKKRLMSKSEKDFSLGKIKTRECVLISKKWFS